MADAADLTRMVPGFDFLQGLLKNAGAGMPNMGQWIAPTLDPQELEKRIQELKTVHFWLEQNAKLLATTIQALEVQRMTLSTLQTMNLPLTDLAQSLKIKPPAPPSSTAAAPSPASGKPTERTAPAAPAVDPMQWWAALTQQFTELATQAVKVNAADTAQSLAGAMVKSTLASTASAVKKATAAPAKAARAAAPRKR